MRLHVTRRLDGARDVDLVVGERAARVAPRGGPGGVELGGIAAQPSSFFFFQAEGGIRDYKVTGVPDVCSSDLAGLWPHRQAAGPSGGPRRRPPPGTVGQGGRVSFFWRKEGEDGRSL